MGNNYDDGMTQYLMDRLEDHGHVRQYGGGIAKTVVAHGLVHRLEIELTPSDYDATVSNILASDIIFAPWAMWLNAGHRTIGDKMVAYFSDEKDMIAFRMMVRA